MKYTTSRLASFLEDDIEDAQALASTTPPSLQRKLLEDIFKNVLDKELNGADSIRLLAVAQSLLAGFRTFFIEDELLRRFEDLIAFAHREVSMEIKEGAIAVSALILNRMRGSRAKISDQTKSYLAALATETSKASQSTIDAVRSRIAAAQARAQTSQIRTPAAFNFPDLDIGRAVSNVSEDIAGDWYRDPWGWPEVAWLDSRRDIVEERLKSTSHGWTAPIDVPKKDGGVRPGIVINPIDRVAYQSLVDCVSAEATADLPKWVYGWRLARSSRTKGIYESNHSEWKSLRAAVVAGSKAFRFTARFDIQSFFRDVDTGLLLGQLSRRYRNASVLDRLESFFHCWHRHPNGSGLPQRSFGSAVLIHALLRPVDTYLDQLCKHGRSRSILVNRWMDDIWIHSNSEDELRNNIAEVEQILGELRLGLNSEKTEIMKRSEPGKMATIDDDYSVEPDDSISLDQLLSSMEDASSLLPFPVNQEISKLIRFKKFTAFDGIKKKGIAGILSLGGGSLARALRESGRWRFLVKDYLEYARQHVSGENLSVANWGEMFPNSPENGIESVRDYFSKQVGSNAQRLLTPLAAQRLAVWQRSKAQSLFEALGKMEALGDPFRLRAVSFAALSAGLSRDKVRESLVDAGDETTVAFLEQTGFSPPSLSRKFASG